mmetsp:Transcript_25338/g.54506  ORF Transcript_25338/g.54506 Transcript_25338/m.54506 type:complete len:284 (-) Transcript_25338:40-891(-)|eukprot:CAMPEP_0172325744 /NCGR_PEP_ID=MMETSP1058-20130122/54676_1 /TAXON_ID=83371 /ORGANISM="Detonula confervacea, Strain CCMP 353" /LENGTH=283 /DNA_ID=CAMNT_0013042353 /DNA_START=41 /DNA_END=892 /DNA_ORIENTATION=-
MVTQQSLLINYNWHHAVNDQSKLNQVLKVVVKDESVVDKNTAFVEAIEADIIYSEVKSQAVMGHPPSIDGDLTLASFLQQLRHVNFQQQHDDQQTECPLLKLDFKSMIALQSSLTDIKNYLTHLPSCLHQRVWINADILPGPGEDMNDATAQKKMQPKFDAAEFLQVVTTELPETVLSIGWTTSLADVHAVYTDQMVDEMVECAKPYSAVTFPVRASCFMKSWGALQTLYQKNEKWTITLWWSRELSKEDFDLIYETLEKDVELRNRTYYDLCGFRNYLSECQ